MLQSAIARHLHTKGIELRVFDSLDSTNIRARSMADAGAKEGLVIIASHQTAGQGTRGRTFYSPDKTGLYMSVVLRPSMRVEDALFITTAAAVAVCRAIERVSDRHPLIKWVNDVYCDGKKVCGILTQASLKTGTNEPDYVILGIGINVCSPAGGFPAELEEIAGAVFEQQGDKAALAAAVLDEFFALYASIDERAFIADYRARSLLLGRDITVSAGTETYKATALDIDNECRLSVRCENGEVCVLSSGDVSIRV